MRKNSNQKDFIRDFKNREGKIFDFSVFQNIQAVVRIEFDIVYIQLQIDVSILKDPEVFCRYPICGDRCFSLSHLLFFLALHHVQFHCRSEIFFG